MRPGHRLTATALAGQLRRKQTRKKKSLSARSLIGRRQRVTGSPPGPSPVITLLPQFASHGRSSSEAAARPAGPEAPGPGRSSPRLPSSGKPDGGPPPRPGSAGGAPGSPAEKDGRDIAPGRPPSAPAPLRPGPSPHRRAGAFEGAPGSGPLPAGPASRPHGPWWPQPSRPAGASVPAPSPFSALRVHAHSGEGSSPRLLGAAPPAVSPAPAAQPGRRPPYLVVVVGVPLLQEGGGRLVLLLELRADGRSPALRRLRRRGRRGLLLR